MKNKTILICLISLLCLLQSAKTFNGGFYSYTDCKGYDNSQWVENEKITFQEKPKSGQKTHVSAVGDLKKDLSIKKVHVIVYYGLNQLLNVSLPYDLKFKAGKGITRKETLPTNFAPPGFFHGQVSFIDDHDKIVMCYDYTIEVAAH